MAIPHPTSQKRIDFIGSDLIGLGPTILILMLQREEDMTGERGESQGRGPGEVKGTSQEGVGHLSVYHRILGT